MSQTAATWKPGTLAAYPIFPEPICPTPMNPILTLSLAPLRLPVKMEEVRAAAPAALRKSLRPVDACAIPLVVSGFPDPKVGVPAGAGGALVLDSYAFNRKQKYFTKPQVKPPQVVG